MRHVRCHRAVDQPAAQNLGLLLHEPPPARPDQRILLLELVERFDRTFLPVAEVTVP